jgi:hypothetical protein
MIVFPLDSVVTSPVRSWKHALAGGSVHGGSVHSDDAQHQLGLTRIFVQSQAKRPGFPARRGTGFQGRRIRGH